MSAQSLPQSPLLVPFHSQALHLKNRVVMAPMTRSRAQSDGSANPLMELYYIQRATAGLLITEATSVSPEGVAYIAIPGIYTQEHIDSWKPITEAVHTKGGKMFMQLMHGGRIGHPELSGGLPTVAPSAILPTGQTYLKGGIAHYPMPEELTIQGIHKVVEAFAQAAKNAIEAGFDGVEIHGANGYLPNQFLAESTNQRTDAYGGTAEGKARFVLEVVDAICQAIGANKTAIRLSPVGTNNGTLHENPLETYTYLIQELAKRDLAYLHLMESFARENQPPHYPQEITATFRPVYPGTLITSGGLTKDKAEAMLKTGLADLAAFGSAYVANPDLVQRFELNAPLNTPDRKTYYMGGEEGYIDYPFLNL